MQKDTVDSQDDIWQRVVAVGLIMVPRAVSAPIRNVNNDTEERTHKHHGVRDAIEQLHRSFKLFVIPNVETRFI
jgi:hypothetical protein